MDRKPMVRFRHWEEAEAERATVRTISAMGIGAMLILAVTAIWNGEKQINEATAWQTTCSERFKRGETVDRNCLTYIMAKAEAEGTK